MKYIYINGYFLTQSINGVQRFANNILLNLDKLITNYKNIKIICLVPKSIDIIFNNIEIKIIQSKIKFLNNKQSAWEQIILPFNCNNGLLINLCNFAPLFKKDQLVVIHDVIPFRLPKTVSFLWGSFYRIMTHIFMRRVKYIASVSHFSATELQKITKINRDIIILGNSGEHIKNYQTNLNILNNFDLNPNSYIFIASSQAHMPHKNIQIINQVATEINIPFVITGYGNNIKNIKQIGRVDDNTLATLYQYAKCVIYPSLYEGFGIPILESLELNNIVIASNIEVFKEIGQNCIIYCNTTIKDDLIKTINKVITNNNIKIELLKNKEIITNKYSWKKITQELISHIL